MRILEVLTAVITPRIRSLKELLLDDGYQDKSLWSLPRAGVRLAASVAEWNLYRSTFGEVSIFNALRQAWESQPLDVYAANWAVTDWYLDGTSGNDANAGTSPATALRTGTELLRKLGTGRVRWGHNVTIHLLTSIADDLTLTYHLTQPGLTILLDGTTTELFRATIASYTASSGNTPRRITATGVANWAIAGPGGTSLVGCRCRMTTGANVGGLFWIAKVAPDGLGTDVARISNPTLRNQQSFVPGVGEEFVVESLPTVAQLNVDASGNVTKNTSVPYTGNFIGQHFASLESEFRLPGYQATFAPILWGCDLRERLTTFQLNDQTGLVVQGSKLSVLSIGSLLSFGNLYVPSSGGSTVYSERFLTHNADTFQGCRLNYQSGILSVSSSIHIMDSVAAGLVVGSRMVVFASSNIAGSGNAGRGVELYPGARVFYRAAFPPTLTGTGGDCLLRTPLNVTIPWTALPWNDGQRSGTNVALAAGTCTVTVPYLLATQAVLVQPNTPGGGGPGELSVPVASRTTTQFVVNSTVAGDTTTIDWSIMPTGYQFIVVPQTA